MFFPNVVFTKVEGEVQERRLNNQKTSSVEVTAKSKINDFYEKVFVRSSF